MKRAAIVFAVLLPALAHAEQPRPSFVAQSGGIVALTMPIAILEDPDVKRQLGSGLTTTFLIIARQRETKSITAARIEIRYDLWDEVWIVRRLEFDGRGERQRIASREALEKWWRTPLRLLETAASRIALQVDLSVLPFSDAEEEDAREWMSKAGGVGTPGVASAGLVDVLIGTTISAKPITSYRWNVDLTLR